MNEFTFYFPLDQIAKNQLFAARCHIPINLNGFNTAIYYLSIQREVTSADIGIYLVRDQLPHWQAMFRRFPFKFKVVVRQGSQVESLASDNLQGDLSDNRLLWGRPNVVRVGTSSGGVFAWQNGPNSHVMVVPSQVLFVDVYVSNL